MKEIKYNKIIRTYDERGVILTYIVVDKFMFEYNTLKEARLMAMRL